MFIRDVLLANDELTLTPYVEWPVKPSLLSAEAFRGLDKWISNCIRYKVWDKISYPFLNFNGANIEV